METVLKAIADWIKGILTAGIMSNLSGLFDAVNEQVGDIAQQVGTRPSAFEPRVFAMIESLSRNVVLPIAGIIIQNDVGNKFAPTVIVAAVTSRVSKKSNQPTHVLIDKNPALSRPSVVLLEQIFTIDKERINNFMGMTSEWEMKQIEEALLRSLGINK